MRLFQGLLGLSAIAVAACTGSNAVLGPGDAGSDAGGDAGVCPQGSVLFQLTAANPDAHCIGAPNSCTLDWLSLRNANGDDVVIDAPCTADCATCEPVGCPAYCAIPTRMTAAGVQRTWDGTYYAAGTCGGMTCALRSCAPAGRYVAKMCAYPDLSSGGAGGVCSPSPAPRCVDVAFDWPPPSTGIVAGALGACCPTGWPMYACAFPNGTPGLACHNPALGCASSMTCGLGCDEVVEGRCGGTNAACTTASDCRLYSDYCGACSCDVLGATDPNPTCYGEPVQCFRDPCQGHGAVCDATGHCALQ